MRQHNWHFNLVPSFLPIPSVILFLEKKWTMIIYEEILALLSGSPELYKFLLTRQEKIPVSDYADIIAGSPVSLDENERLLELLFNSVENRIYTGTSSLS